MVDIAVYRARIGTFCMPRKIKERLKVLRVEKGTISVCLKLAVFVSMLVILGGDVELNPGPRSRGMRQSTLSFVDEDLNSSLMDSSQSSQTSHGKGTKAGKPGKSAQDSEVMSFLREMKAEMKSDLGDINGKITNMNESLNSLREENESLKRENIEIKRELSTLSSKIDKLEGHSRRNNLRFIGIRGRSNENWDESEKVVRKFISEDLHMNGETVGIERAHRIGSRHTDKCTIIVKFSSYKEKEDILQKARVTLGRESGYTVREDYTDRVLTHRRELSKMLVDARERGRYASLRYDKLIVDGSVYKYCDETEKIVLLGAARGRNTRQNTTDSPPRNRGNRLANRINSNQDTSRPRDHTDSFTGEDVEERGAIGGST